MVLRTVRITPAWVGPCRVQATKSNTSKVSDAIALAAPRYIIAKASRTVVVAIGTQDLFKTRALALRATSPLIFLEVPSISVI